MQPYHPTTSRSLRSPDSPFAHGNSTSPATPEFPLSLVRPGDLVFDVGANLGAKAERFLAAGARVVCVEPQPDCAARLRHKFAGNASVAIEEKGLAEKPGTRQFSICSAANTISTFSEEWKKGRFADYKWDRVINVQVTTLDELIRQHGVPRYCKIDVEGFELSVLEGLTRRMPCVSFEFTIEFLANARRCVEHLERLGFTRFNVCLGENKHREFPQWLDARQLFAQIATLEMEELWGDIYAESDCVSDTAGTANSPAAVAAPGPLELLQQGGVWRAGTPLRLHLGCGEQHFDGYVNIDYPPAEHHVMNVKADVFADITKLDFPPGSVDEIRLHHVFEHFSRVTALGMLIRWHGWLKVGGKLRIETPDILGGARTLTSNASLKVKMGVARHIAGDQADSWAYHVEHWWPERYEHTLKSLGYDVFEIRSSSWSQEPFLSNVETIALKRAEVSRETQLAAADNLLWESTVSPAEKPTWEVWRKQLRDVLALRETTGPANTTPTPAAVSPAPAPQPAPAAPATAPSHPSHPSDRPDQSALAAVRAALATHSSPLPLEAIHDFNQRSRDAWMRQQASEIPAGSRVLDVGAGTCPYRQFFAHCDYRTHDFKKFEGVKLGNTTAYGNIDFVSDIAAIPAPDAAFDVVICTEVLEHVPEPIAALREMARLVRPGGRLLLTAPLMSGLHQLPFHFYSGYTPEWYKHFGAKFGLDVTSVTPNGGAFRLLAQETARVAWTWNQHGHLHGEHAGFIRELFNELLPRFLFGLEDKCFNDQLTAGYFVAYRKQPVAKSAAEFTTNSTAAPQPRAKNTVAAAPPRRALTALVFSKDRPLQLDATLRSFAMHCADAPDVSVKVLFTTSTPELATAYEQVQREHRGVELMRETNFRADTLRLLAGAEQILFLVDDTIFVQPFRLGACADALAQNPAALGVSLRLGRNTTNCYSLNRTQALPAFAAAPHGLLDFVWPAAACDFGYPLEVSSSLYRVSEVLPLLQTLAFTNPNTLEARFSEQAPKFATSHPRLLCPAASVAFSVPANKVQTTFNNRAAQDSALSATALAARFANGERIAIGEFNGFTPNGCHQEVPLKTVKIGAAVPVPPALCDDELELRSRLGEALRRNGPLPVEEFLAARRVFEEMLQAQDLVFFVQAAPERLTPAFFALFAENILEVRRAGNDALAGQLESFKQGIAARLTPKANNVTATKAAPKGLPTVSVIVPCFRQADLLPETVASVLAQTFTDWELLIVNDGSPDNTSAVARELIANNPDRRIRLLEKSNGGLSDARNAGMREARGRYLVPLDSDDLLQPAFLAKTVAALDADPKISIAYTDVEQFGHRNEMWFTHDGDPRAVLANTRHAYCALFRREVWESVGGYNRNMVWGYEDWDFWVGCFAKGFQGRRIAEPLMRYRTKAESMITKAREHDLELKAQIVLNHPQLYTPTTREGAEKILADARRQREAAATASQTKSENPMGTAKQTKHANSPNALNPTPSPPSEGGEGRGEEGRRALEKPLSPTLSPLVPRGARETVGFGSNNSSASAKPTNPANELSALLDAANAAFQCGDLASTRDALTRAAELSPQDGDICESLGCVLFQLGEVKLAHREFSKANRLRPDRAETLVKLAMAAVRLDHIEEFEAALGRALELEPEHREGLKLLGDLNIDAGHYSHAGQAFLKILETHPADMDSLLSLGLCCYKVGDQPAAQACYERALAIDSHNAVAKENLAALGIPTDTAAGAQALAAVSAPQVSKPAVSQSFQPANRPPAPALPNGATRAGLETGDTTNWEVGGTDSASTGAPSSSAPPRISVILPTYNRPQILAQCLAGFAAQTLPKDQFEIVIVDDGSQPPVEDVAQHFAAQLRLIYHYQPNCGLAVARNQCIELARAPWLALHDDDDVPAADYLARCVAFHEAHPAETDILLAQVAPAPTLARTALLEWMFDGRNGVIGFPAPGVWHGFDKFYGGTSSCKRSLFAHAQYDPEYRFGYEDMELALRLSRVVALRVEYHPEVVSQLVRGPEFAGMFRRSYREGRSLRRCFEQHGEAAFAILSPEFRQCGELVSKMEAKLAGLLDLVRKLEQPNAGNNVTLTVDGRVLAGREALLAAYSFCVRYARARGWLDFANRLAEADGLTRIDFALTPYRGAAQPNDSAASVSLAPRGTSGERAEERGFPQSQRPSSPHPSPPSEGGEGVRHTANEAVLREQNGNAAQTPGTYSRPTSSGSLAPRGTSGERAGERGFVQPQRPSSPHPSPPSEGGEGVRHTAQVAGLRDAVASPGDAAAREAAAKTALAYFHSNLYPPRSGAHRRCLSLLQGLKALGYDVTLVSCNLFTDQPWNDESVIGLEREQGIHAKIYYATAADREYVAQTQARSGLWGMHTPPGLVNYFRQLGRELSPAVVLVNYAYCAELADAPEFAAATRVVEMHDLVSLSGTMAGLAWGQLGQPPYTLKSVSPAFLDEKFFAKQGLTVDPEEFRRYGRFDVVTAISNTEAAQVQQKVPGAQVAWLPMAHNVPTVANSYSGPPVFVIFTNPFNLQGYLYFIERVLPKVRRAIPGFTLRVIGDACKVIKAVPGVELLGFVPELQGVYAQARFAICPLIGGTGQQVKIVEAMAHGLPVVSLSNVAASSPIENGVNGFIADTAEQFADAVIRLHQDSALCRKMGQAAREKIAAENSTHALTRRLGDALATAVNRRANAAAPTAAAVATATTASPLVTTASAASPVSAAPATALQRPVRWLAPFFNPSGYASEAINFVLPLAERTRVGILHHTRVTSEKFVAGLAADERQRLFELRDRFDSIRGGIVVCHNVAPGFARVADGEFHIGRTMFETDGLPLEWVTQCNQMDEVWVPSRFNLESFAASGVERRKLRVMPEAVDAAVFDPAKHTPLPLPNRAACNFLSIFEWSRRKAWDVLLAAYLREFSAGDDVCLYLRTYLMSQPDGDPTAAIQQLIREHAATLGLGDKALPRIEILAEQVSTADLPRLYLAADCLVAPSRGEGWGRPQHEAMMMGRPVIATNFSGTTEFMTAQTAYLLDYELAEVKDVDPEHWHYFGHHWANPSEAHLRQLLRRVQQNPEEARAKGAAARAHVVKHFSREPVAELVAARLAEIEQQLSAPSLPAAAATPLLVEQEFAERKPQTLCVDWEGSFLDYGSLSHVNREFTRQLARQPRLQVNCVNTVAAAGAAGAVVPVGLEEVARRLRAKPSPKVQITVRHAWPPNWTRPGQGAWVAMQPWEFGVLPDEWAARAAEADELWVYSEYVRRVYVDSGVDPAKVKIVPLGIDPARFQPGATPMKLATAKAFKFLFVGGTIGRKGADVLLEAYLRSFTAADDVCLVIKDFGGRSVYTGQTLETQIRAAQARPNAPEILYLTDELAPEALPGLYAACQCLVHPYRGEGFGLPVLEAMACGLPVVVTGGGSTDDFADDTHAYRIPALRRSLGEKVGELKLVYAGWLLEPSAPELATRLRWVAANRAEAAAKGRAAGEYVRREWTWERSARVASQRLQNLAARVQAEMETVRIRRARRGKPLVLPATARLGHLGAAVEALRKNQLVPAWNAATEAVTARPFHPEAWLLLAEIAQLALQPELARQCVEHARALTPQWKKVSQFAKANHARGRTRVELPGLPEALTRGVAEPRLTVCVIARNEERFLGKCLGAVRGLAQQIVVVDTGSTDRTVAIAHEHGAEVHSFAWAEDFSAARNAALEHARGEWILFIDADEELTPQGRATLLAEMRAANVMAYRFPMIDVGREHEGRSFVPRLFRNAPGLFYVGRVHEQVFSSVVVRCEEWGTTVELGKTELLHYGYSVEMVRGRNKMARNLRLLLRAMEELPNEPNLIMNLGLELVRAGHLARGLEQYYEAFALMSELPPQNVPPELCEALLTQMATRLTGAKRFAEVVGLLRSPLAKARGLTASLHFFLGLALQEQGQFDEAAREYRECVAKRGRLALTPINPDILGSGPEHCLANCLLRLERKDEARAAFAGAVQQAKPGRAVRWEYARFLAEQGDFVEALNLLHALVSERPEDAAAWNLGGQIALRQAEFLEFALDWTGEALRALPLNPALITQRAEALMFNGELEAALPLWRQVQGSGQHASLAALVLCEVLTGDRQARLGAGEEAAVSREFLQLFRRLVGRGAEALVRRLHTHLGALGAVLPGAAGVLGEVLAQAEEAVV